MKFILSLILISAFQLTPQQMILNMGKAIYTSEKTIKIGGRISEKEKVSFEFNKEKATLKKEGNSSFLDQEDFPLFLQLFFFSDDLDGQKAPEDFSKKILSSLKSAGIDTEKKTLTVVKSTNEAGISIGKNKRFTKASELVLYKKSFLPATLKLSKVTYRFLDYNKSVRPMVFPGRIEILQDGKVIETWTFYRKEFYPE